MENNDSEKSDYEDKCDNCGNENSTQFWDYDDGTVLCDRCHSKIGDKWQSLAETNAADENEKGNEKSKAKHSSAAPKFGRSTKKYVIGAAVLIIGLLLLFSARNILAGGGASNPNYQSGKDNPTTGGSLPANTGDVQNVKLALVDFSYKMTPNEIKVGVPVRMEVDASTLSGCMTTVVIKDFGVRKHITAQDNIIEFTPTKTGTFWITCGMGMGPGSFTVVNADGTADANAAPAASPPPAGTCGGSGAGGATGGCGGGSTGGCGCGG